MTSNSKTTAEKLRETAKELRTKTAREKAARTAHALTAAAGIEQLKRKLGGQ